MLSERPFFSAIIISLFIHGIILMQMPGLNFASRQAEPLPLKIEYTRNTEDIKEQAGLKSRQGRPLLRLPPLVTANRESSPFRNPQGVFNKKMGSGQADERIFSKPSLPKPDINVIKKKIFLAPPKESLNKINSPSYIGYFQLTREKIKRILYEKYTYTEEGEVYLSFIIAHDGTMKEVRINEEQSSSSPYLREIAVASVKEASPFPAFPKDLEYPELSFNVIVSFEVE